MAIIKISPEHVRGNGWGLCLIDKHNNKYPLGYTKGPVKVRDDIAAEFEGNPNIVIEYGCKKKVTPKKISKPEPKTEKKEEPKKLTADEIDKKGMNWQHKWLKNKGIKPARYEKGRIKQILDNQ